MAGSLYWQLTASVSQIARSVGDPSTTAAYFQPAAPLAARPRRRRASGRGAADRQPLGVGLPGAQFELARGWLRQLDTTRDDIFYDDDELTDARLQRLAARATRSPTSPCPTRRSTTPRSPSGR